jgi:ubiquinone/menaquinone biosynthesis C-methylase UbiE
MGLDPLVRFSSRVQHYIRYRPSYPVEVIALLERQCGLNPEFNVADVGSGTGLFAKLLLDSGCRVIGVEPNADMRQAGEEYLSQYLSFTSQEGQAERTGLPDNSVDLITSAQAFHWFQPDAAREEFRRILKPGGCVALIWNERRVPPDGFLAGYEDLLQTYAPEYSKVDHRRIGPTALGAFYTHQNWNESAFEYVQEFDLEGLRGRLLSSSYAPQEGSAQYEPMMGLLTELFRRFEVNGQVSFMYETRVFYGRLNA